MTEPWYDGHLDRGPDGGSAPIWQGGPAGYGPGDPAGEAEDAADEEYAAQRRTELAAELTDAGPEPGTNEWHIETGNYIDPEPDWDAGEPYLDQAHGVAYWDTAAAMEAGRERWPGYRHVGPEPETEPEAQ